MNTVLRRCFAVMLSLAAPAALADSGDADFFGLLRARDITPFGFLRLDMRPAHAHVVPSGGWGIETELAYQNTWALSPRVEKYLGTLSGRREIGPAELDAIRQLPGENYLVDLELALLDVTLHYKFSSQWGAYLVLSGAWYGGGFLDSTIEGFHDTFGFSDFGRPVAKRNDINYILDLKTSQAALFEEPTAGGMLDPTFGLRYSGITFGDEWKVIYSREDTDLDELLATKYQLSLGIYRRIGGGLISFAVTENLQNINNTPDIGVQLGFAFSPSLRESR